MPWWSDSKLLISCKWRINILRILSHQKNFSNQQKTNKINKLLRIYMDNKIVLARKRVCHALCEIKWDWDQDL
jgi:hypothetical protein